MRIRYDIDGDEVRYKDSIPEGMHTVVVPLKPPAGFSGTCAIAEDFEKAGYTMLESDDAKVGTPGHVLMGIPEAEYQKQVKYWEESHKELLEGSNDINLQGEAYSKESGKGTVTHSAPISIKKALAEAGEAQIEAAQKPHINPDEVQDADWQANFNR